MTIPTDPISPFSPFLPSTYNMPEDQESVREWIGSNLSDISDCVNDKKIGAYTQATPSQNGEKWSYLTTSKIRTGSQSISYIPSLPNTGTLTLTRQTIPQYPTDNIQPQFVITKLFGTASKPCSAVNAGDGDYFMYNAQGDSRVSFTCSDTTIVITTTTDLSGYSGFIVMEFVRDGT